MTYLQLLQADQISYEAINDFIDNFHARQEKYNLNERRSLPEYLGMTDLQYAKYVENPGYLRELKYDGKNSETTG